MRKPEETLSVCCKQPIEVYKEYNLKVCAYCKAEVHVNKKPTISIASN